MIGPRTAIRDLILTPKLMKIKDHLLKRQSPSNPFNVVHFLGRERASLTQVSEPSATGSSCPPKALVHALLWFMSSRLCPPRALPSLGFSRQEYWSGLPFPSPGDLPDPGIEPRSPELQADSLPSEPPWKPPFLYCCPVNKFFGTILLDSIYMC